MVSWGGSEWGTQKYRIKVHIFGAVSSPGFTIFALKFIVKKYTDLGLEASRFISNDFYMNDGLTSVSNTFNSWCSCSMCKGKLATPQVCLKWQESHRNLSKVRERSSRSWPITGKLNRRKSLTDEVVHRVWSISLSHSDAGPTCYLEGHIINSDFRIWSTRNDCIFHSARSAK